LERDPALVLQDVVNGFVSLESALHDYGVVVDVAARQVDKDATARLRKKQSPAA
jgi:N-methylhydantoinase B